MSKHELITIIVPIFNTEYYLKECLDSLQAQSYSNLEILLVNDGSTDHSGDICRAYCRRDSRFNLIEQQNGGLARSRNAGLNRAKGKYVCFVDSDDFVHRKYVEILYKNLVEHQADLSMCAYLKYRQGQKPESDIDNCCSNISRWQMLQAVTTTGPDNTSEKTVVAWNKLIPMDIMRYVRFPDRLHEDEFMINALLPRISRVVWTDTVLYYYRQRPESITGTERQKDIRHLDALDAVYDRLRIFSGEEYKDLFPDMLRSYFENSTMLYYGLLSSGSRWKIWKKICPRYFAALIRYGKKLRAKQFLRYTLFLISPYLYHRKYWPQP